MKFFFTSLVTLSTCAVSQADTLTVCSSGCDFTSINAAIDVASNGDVIQLSAETYSEGEEITIDGKSITVRGVVSEDGAVVTTLDGSGVHRLLDIRNTPSASVRLEHLAIINGVGQSFSTSFESAGGGISADNATIDLVNCTFMSCSAEYGGALVISTSVLSASSCRFEENIVRPAEQGFSASCRGGAICSLESTVDLTACVFDSNEAIGTNSLRTGYGGGAYFEFTQARMFACVFIRNTSTSFGGGIATLSGAVGWDQCDIRLNTSPNGGGVFDALGGVGTYTDSSFIGNSANALFGSPGGGGAIQISGASSLFRECMFLENFASSTGGVGFFKNYLEYPTSLSIQDCVIRTNSSSEFAGGFFLARGTDTVFERIDVEGNSSEFGGGIYYGCGSCQDAVSSLVIRDSVFRNNTAYSDFGGGGIYADGSLPEMAILSTEVCENEGSQIGGGYRDKGGNCIAEICIDCDSSPCPEDLNGDDQVDGSDVGLFFVEWGCTAPSSCTADFNQDGLVDGTDLGLLFVRWGPCNP